ncbi:MAG: amidohydrolase family protein [Desulfomonile tiedjei]|nr:amidohydrolase family protein [Desulfomonile tiedjei]
MNEAILEGRVVFPDGVRPAGIVIDSAQGSIVSVDAADGPVADIPLIFPGFIDIHVHAREYAEPSDADPAATEKWEATLRKETFVTAGRAALNGGVTLFAAMPNDPTPPDNPRQYARKLALSSSSPCPVVVFAVVTPRSEPWGDVPYKVYLDVSASPVSFTDWQELENALKRYRGCRLFFHAEDPKILAKTGGASPRWKTRPPEAEIAAVEKILELTAKLGLHTHLCHLSTARAVELIREYNRGTAEKVSCEVTPHHLFFSVDDRGVRSGVTRQVPAAALLDCNPPLRSEDDRRYLVTALKEGFVDVLASDHAPHTLADKEGGAPGMPHLDTLGAFAGWLMTACDFPPERVAEIFSQGPARIFSPDLDLVHGVVQEGAAASFTLLDITDSTLVEGNEIRGRGPLQTRCGWSPFDRIPLPARVTGVIVRGKTDFR